MTRLQTHRRKQNNVKILILIILSIGLLFAIFQIGLKSSISAAVFVNRLIRGESAETQTENTEEEFYGLLNVDEPEIATNSAEIIVSGDASEFKEVDFYINNVKVGNDKVASSGSFSEKIGKLKVGENDIYIIAKDESGKHSKRSEVYNVSYYNEKPTLEIESPKDGDTVNKVDLQIKGKTDKDVTVRVNNHPVVVGIDGAFTSTYRLKEGENKLEITATDIAGNEEKQELTVRYEKDE